MFVSYAQNFEDVMLHRVFGSVGDGFYIDIGAWHPDLHSVTKHFYDMGWTGINIEPSKSYARLLKRRRRRDINLDVAIGSAAAKTWILWKCLGLGCLRWEKMLWRAPSDMIFLRTDTKCP